MYKECECGNYLHACGEGKCKKETEKIAAQAAEIERLREGIQHIADTGRPSTFDKALYALLSPPKETENE